MIHMAKRPRVGKRVIYTTDEVIYKGTEPETQHKGLVESIDKNITPYDKNFYYYIRNDDSGKLDVVKSMQILDYVEEEYIKTQIVFKRPITEREEHPQRKANA
jgi:phage tail sheath gpL-like